MAFPEVASQTIEFSVHQQGIFSSLCFPFPDSTQWLQHFQGSWNFFGQTGHGSGSQFPAQRCTQTSPIPQFHTAELFLAHGFISRAASQMSKEHLAYPHRRGSRHCAGLRAAFAFEVSSPSSALSGMVCKAWENQPGFIFRTVLGSQQHP